MADLDRERFICARLLLQRHWVNKPQERNVKGEHFLKGVYCLFWIACASLHPKGEHHFARQKQKSGAISRSRVRKCLPFTVKPKHLVGVATLAQRKRQALSNSASKSGTTLLLPTREMVLAFWVQTCTASSSAFNIPLSTRSKSACFLRLAACGLGVCREEHPEALRGA